MSEEKEWTDGLIPITVQLDRRVVDWLDRFTEELGLRSRGDMASRLLTELAGIDEQVPGPIPSVDYGLD